ncbi:hypothetical protein AVEN_245491-1 [Araneus ventricosus]|uniref:Uncharacterized protein n=1 Tax=Araneus ventricosus TaxID=182803 RepID=A0A4Y2D7N8_ARAVE|nr:hypothetical protein AVEN_245491-1 [Araneus ventricosus]
MDLVRYTRPGGIRPQHETCMRARSRKIYSSENSYLDLVNLFNSSAKRVFSSQMKFIRTAVPNPWAAAHLWAANSVLVGSGWLVKSRSQRNFKSIYSFFAL